MSMSIRIHVSTSRELRNSWKPMLRQIDGNVTFASSLRLPDLARLATVTVRAALGTSSSTMSKIPATDD